MDMFSAALKLPACPDTEYCNNLQTVDIHPQMTSTVQSENGRQEISMPNLLQYGTKQMERTKSFVEESRKHDHSRTSSTKITETVSENSFKCQFHYQKEDPVNIENEQSMNDWFSVDHMVSGYSADKDVHNFQDYPYQTSLNPFISHSQYSLAPSTVQAEYGNNTWDSDAFLNWTYNNSTEDVFTEPEVEHTEKQGVRDLEEHDWRVRTCVGCQRTKQQAERAHQAALSRARRAPALALASSTCTSSASQRPRAAPAPRPRPPRAPALRSVVLRPGPAPRSASLRPVPRAAGQRPGTPRAPAWRPVGWRPATPHSAGVSRLSSLRPVTPRPRFSARPRPAQPTARPAARSGPRAANLPTHLPGSRPRPPTRSSDDFPTDPRLRSPWYKRRLTLHLLKFLISEERRNIRAMKRARAAAADNQARSRAGRSPLRTGAHDARAGRDAQEAQVRDPRRRNDRDLRLRAMERARADRLGASDTRGPRARGATNASASPPRPFRRPFTDEPVPTAASERTPPRTVPIAEEDLHDNAPTAVINGVVWRTNKLGDDAVEPGIGLCYRFWRTWLRTAQEEGGAIRAQSFRVREFNLAEARLARQEVAKARRLLRLPPRDLPLAPPPPPHRPPTGPPRLVAPALTHCCECCQCCTCLNCCACDEVEECCGSCESCRQVMEEHSRARCTPSPPPPPPPPPPLSLAPVRPPTAQPLPPPLAFRRSMPPPPPPSLEKPSVPIMPLLLLSMMVPNEEKSPDPPVSPPAVSPFPYSVWPTLLHSHPPPVPGPQSPEAILDSISASLHSQDSMDQNLKVPVCAPEIAAHSASRREPPPIEVVSGEDSSSSSVIVISPSPPLGVSRPTAVVQSNQQLSALPLPTSWPTLSELPLIPLPSGEPRVLKTVKSVSPPQSQRHFASIGYLPENVADIPLPDAPPPRNVLSLTRLPTTPESSLNNPMESFQFEENEPLTSSNHLLVDMDLDED